MASAPTRPCAPDCACASGRLGGAVRWGTRLFVLLVLLDEVTTFLGLRLGLDESNTVYTHLAGWTHLPIALLLIVTAAPKVLVALGAALVLRQLGRLARTRYDRALVVLLLASGLAWYARTLVLNASHLLATMVLLHR